MPGTQDAGGRILSLAVPAPVDPHAILGLEHGATREQIELAWRQAARETHPDRLGGSPERFRLARWAFEALMEPCSCDDPRCRRAAHVAAPRDALQAGADRHRPLTISAGVAITGGIVMDNLGRQIRIPADTGIGDELRLRGLGGPGHPPGDLILTIDIAAAPPWRRQDLDLIGFLPVTWLELYSGRAVQIFAFGKPITIPVGPHTEPFGTVDLPGLGLRRGDDRGVLRLIITPVAATPGDPTLESVLLRLQQGAGDSLRESAFAMLHASS